MPTIGYDHSCKALLRPELRETVFQHGVELSMEQIAVEAARLAYLRIEEAGDARSELSRLTDALGLIHGICIHESTK